MSPVTKWDQCRLGEVTVPASTWNPRREPRPSIRYIDVSAVSRDDLKIVSAATHSTDNAPSRARKIVETGDTIFATVRPTLRRIAQIPVSLDGQIVSTAFCVLRPDPRTIDADFLYFAMQLESVMEGIAAMASGASYPAVRDVDVIDQVVPLPPLSEQRKIAAVLSTIRTGLLHEAQCESNATALKRAATRELFTHGLRGEAQKETEIGLLPDSWDLKSIGDHFSVVSGGTPSRRVSEFWVNGAIPWVKTTEIDYGVIQETEEYITQAGLERSAAKLLPPGTLLLAMYGQGVTRGKVAILGVKAACNQACAALSPNDTVVDTRYLFHFLSFRYKPIRQLAHGGQQQNLNLEIVRNLRVAFPITKGLQFEIVAIIDAIDRKIDLHRRKRAVLNDLFKALLHKLMIGEIRVTHLDLSALVHDTKR